MSGTLSLARVDGIATITIDNRTVRNAMSVDMADQLAQFCDEIDRDLSIGCAVLRGAGDAFCSGADTRSWDAVYGSDPLSDSAYDVTDRIYGSFMRFGRLKMPTIAAVRGPAVGAGLNLALAADIRIVANDARLKAGFAAAGIHPGGGYFTLVNRIVGPELAAFTGMFGIELSGDRACQIGMASISAPDHQIDRLADSYARGVAADPILARRMKHTFALETRAAPLDWQTAVEVERGVQQWSQRRRFHSQGTDS